MWLQKGLRKGIVNLDKPTWTKEGLETNIKVDLIMVSEAIKEKVINEDEYVQFEEDKLSFEELKAVYRKAAIQTRTLYVNLSVNLISRIRDFKKRYTILKNRSSRIR